MKKRYTYIFTVIVLVIVIISALAYNLIKLNATINNVYSIAYERYYNHLSDIDQNPIIDKENLNIKHIQSIQIHMLRAAEDADIIGAVSDNTYLYLMSNHIVSLLGDIEASYNRFNAFTQIDYENYLKAREYINKLKNLLGNEKYKDINNKSARELNTNIANLYSEFLKKIGY